jgi:hypothetical protein
MVQFADAIDHNDGLVRKGLGLILAVAPMSETPLTSILDDTTGDLADLSGTGFVLLGRPSEDGVNFARETETSEIFGLGSIDPSRSDIRRAVKRATFTCNERRKKILELAQGVSDLGETTTRTTAGTVETTWDEAHTPLYPYMRLLVIAQDLSADGEFYIGKLAMRTKITEVGEEVWSDQDTPAQTPLTFTFFNDPAVGTPLRHFEGGPGYESVATAMGFTVPPAV